MFFLFTKFERSVICYILSLFKFEGRFQEDGSFIGQYGTLRRTQIANAAAAVALSRAAAQAQAHGPGTYV